jgi:hypothetical protein
VVVGVSGARAASTHNRRQLGVNTERAQDVADVRPYRRNSDPKRGRDLPGILTCAKQG